MVQTMTDNEIKKALECCVNGNCPNCPMGHRTTGTYNEKCGDDLMSNALDLINRLQAENENLKAEVEKQKKKVEARNKVLQDKITENERLQENQRPQYTDPMDFCGVLCVFSEELIAKAKAKAYKEFAERLKEQMYQSSDWSHGEHPFVVEESDIDTLLEELVGE